MAQTAAGELGTLTESKEHQMTYIRFACPLESAALMGVVAY